MAYHLWCGSAKFQHEQHRAEIYKFEQRIKKLEGETRDLQRKVKKGIRLNESARCLSQLGDMNDNGEAADDETVCLKISCVSGPSNFLKIRPMSTK